MTTVTYARLGAERPSFWKVLVAVLLGYLAAFVALGAAALGLTYLGALGSSGISHPRRGLLDTPYLHAGLSSALADVVLLLTVVLVAAVCIRAAVESQTDRSISLARVAGVVVLTGIPPFVDRGLLPLTPFVAWIATAFLIHAYALDAPPLRLERRLAAWPARRLAAIAAACAVALLASLGYGLAHPLVFGGFSGALNGTPSGLGSHQLVVYRANRPATYEFSLRNGGFASVRLLGVRLPPDRQWMFRGQSLSTGMTIAGKSTAALTLHLNTNVRCTGGDLSLSRVLVRYRLLGRTFVQAVPLDQRPAIRCTP